MDANCGFLWDLLSGSWSCLAPRFKEEGEWPWRMGAGHGQQKTGKGTESNRRPEEKLVTGIDGLGEELVDGRTHRELSSGSWSLGEQA